MEKDYPWDPLWEYLLGEESSDDEPKGELRWERRERHPESRGPEDEFPNEAYRPVDIRGKGRIRSFLGRPRRDALEESRDEVETWEWELDRELILGRSPVQAEHQTKPKTRNNRDSEVKTGHDSENETWVWELDRELILGRPSGQEATRPKGKISKLKTRLAALSISDKRQQPSES
jgi:hypothetical protein